jgi:hypothetical protein
MAPDWSMSYGAELIIPLVSISISSAVRAVAFMITNLLEAANREN